MEFNGIREPNRKELLEFLKNYLSEIESDEDKTPSTCNKEKECGEILKR